MLRLTRDQETAVDRVTEIWSAERNVILKGSTGCGKTRVAFNSVMRFYLMPEQREVMEKRIRGGRSGFVRVLVLVPAPVVKQWCNEMTEKGQAPPDQVFRYSGQGRAVRRRKLRRFMCDDVKPMGPKLGAVASFPFLFVVVGPEMLRDEFERVRSGDGSDGSPLHRDWDILLVDEAHKFRNGVCHTPTHWEGAEAAGRHEASENEGALKVYSTLEKFVLPRVSRSMWITATPVITSTLDLYAIVKHCRPRSKTLLERASYDDTGSTSLDNIDLVQSTFNAVERDHVVNVPAMKGVPPPVVRVIAHGLTPREEAEYMSCHCHVEKICAQMRRVAHAKGNQSMQEARRRLTYSLFIYKARLQDGLLYPEYYREASKTGAGKGEPTASDSEEEHGEEADGLEEEAGEKREACDDTDDDEFEEETLEEGEVEFCDPECARTAIERAQAMSEPAGKFGIEDCSKMRALIERMRSDPYLLECKVLVFAYRVRPLRRLARFLREAFPHRPVALHLGGQATLNAETIERFRAMKLPGIMLASRGSMGEGVDLDMIQTVVFLDEEPNRAKEKQCIGRIIRPHAQLRDGQRAEDLVYHVYYVRCFLPSIELFQRRYRARKTHDLARAAGEPQEGAWPPLNEVVEYSAAAGQGRLQDLSGCHPRATPAPPPPPKKKTPKAFRTRKTPRVARNVYRGRSDPVYARSSGSLSGSRIGFSTLPQGQQFRPVYAPAPATNPTCAAASSSSASTSTVGPAPPRPGFFFGVVPAQMSMGHQ